MSAQRKRTVKTEWVARDPETGRTVDLFHKGGATKSFRQSHPGWIIMCRRVETIAFPWEDIEVIKPVRPLLQSAAPSACSPQEGQQ